MNSHSFLSFLNLLDTIIVSTNHDSFNFCAVPKIYTSRIFYRMVTQGTWVFFWVLIAALLISW